MILPEFWARMISIAAFDIRKKTFQIGFQNEIPIGFAGFKDILRLCCSRIVDKNIQSAEFGTNEIEQGRNVGTFADIRLKGNRRPAIFPNLFANALRMSRIGSIVHNNGSAFFRENRGNPPAETA